MYRLSCDVIGLPFRTAWLLAGMNTMPMGMGMQQQPAGDFNLLSSPGYVHREIGCTPALKTFLMLVVCLSLPVKTIIYFTCLYCLQR